MTNLFDPESANVTTVRDDYNATKEIKKLGIEPLVKFLEVIALGLDIKHRLATCPLNTCVWWSTPSLCTPSCWASLWGLTQRGFGRIRDNIQDTT